MPRVTKAAPENRRAQRKKRVVPVSVATQFKPGVSPNPGGKPKWAAFSQLARERLLEPVPDDEKGRTHSEVLFDMAFEKARKGDIEAASFLLDRAEGRPVQSINSQVTSLTLEEKVHNAYAGMTLEQLIAKEAELFAGLPLAERQKLLPGTVE